MIVQRPFGYEAEAPKPEVFIQWKNTNACFDFWCECGHHGHYDGDFAYLIICGGCSEIWEMPWNLYPRKARRSDMTPLEQQPE